MYDWYIYDVARLSGENVEVEIDITCIWLFRTASNWYTSGFTYMYNLSREICLKNVKIGNRRILRVLMIAGHSSKFL